MSCQGFVGNSKRQTRVLALELLIQTRCMLRDPEASIFSIAVWWGIVCSPILEIALVLVRFDHVASFIVNSNHSPM